MFGQKTLFLHYIYCIYIYMYQLFGEKKKKISTRHLNKILF